MSKSRDLSRFHAGSLDIDAGNVNVDGSVTADGLVVDGATDLNGDLDVSGGDVIVGGGVYLGGTGAANKLDDYEEGTWTPVFSNMYTSTGSYTKVGNKVTCWIYMVTTETGSSGTAFGGLPFIIYNTTGRRGCGAVGYQNSNVSESMTVLTNGSSSYGFTFRVASTVQELAPNRQAWATFSYETNS